MATRRRRGQKAEAVGRDEGGEEERGARAFWSGTISFGLVAVPVALFPATRPSGGSLRMLAPDGTPLERRWYCPTDEHDVPWDELTRGFEMEDGSYVELTDQELEAAAPEKSRDIDLRVFVPRESLDPVFFEQPYYLTPAGESTKAYRLLVEAMERTGFAGIATFVMRTKEYLIAIVADGGLLRAETLRWAGEVRTPKDVGLRKSSKVKAATVKAIEKAIDGLAADALDESELADTAAEKLEALVAKKLKSGKGVIALPDEVTPEPSQGGIIDLMEALKKSMEGRASSAPKSTRSKPASEKPHPHRRTRRSTSRKAG